MEDRYGTASLLEVPQKEDPLMVLMRQYVQTKHDFDDACVSFNKASEHRRMVENELKEVSQKVQDVVAQGVYDPTAPQPANAQGNSLSKGYIPQANNNF